MSMIDLLKVHFPFQFHYQDWVFPLIVIIESPLKLWLFENIYLTFETILEYELSLDSIESIQKLDLH